MQEVWNQSFIFTHLIKVFLIRVFKSCPTFILKIVFSLFMLKTLENVILTTYNVMTIIEKNPNGQSSLSSSFSKVPNGHL